MPSWLVLLVLNHKAGNHACRFYTKFMDASSLRRATTLPLATGRNKTSIRYNTTNDTTVVSNGTNWVPLNYFHITYRQQPNGELADEAFFIATRACKVVSVSEVHSTAGSDAGAVSLQVVKDTGTNAPGAGTDLLTNNSNVGFNLKGTANTVQTGVLTATAASLTLAAGDRLSVDFAGVLTALAGVVVTVHIAEV